MTRQEEAFNYISERFTLLINRDKKIDYDTKRSITAFWEDLFASEPVRNNMEQALSNFLWEMDKKMDSSRKAGIASVKELLEQQYGNPDFSPTVHVPIARVIMLLNSLLKAEDAEEETVSADINLKEVGGGGEDDTPVV